MPEKICIGIPILCIYVKRKLLYSRSHDPGGRRRSKIDSNVKLGNLVKNNQENFDNSLNRLESYQYAQFMIHS